MKNLFTIVFSMLAMGVLADNAVAPQPEWIDEDAYTKYEKTGSWENATASEGVIVPDEGKLAKFTPTKQSDTNVTRVVSVLKFQTVSVLDSTSTISVTNAKTSVTLVKREDNDKFQFAIYARSGAKDAEAKWNRVTIAELDPTTNTEYTVDTFIDWKTGGLTYTIDNKQVTDTLYIATNSPVSTIQFGGKGYIKTLQAGFDPRNSWVLVVPEEASEEVIKEAASRVAPKDEKAVLIVDKTDFNNFQKYLQDKDELTNSKNATLAFAMNATEAKPGELEDGDVEIKQISTTDGEYEISVKIEGFTAGDEVNEELLVKLVKAMGSTSLKDFSTENVSVQGVAGDEGNVLITVKPADKLGTPDAFFMKVQVLK